MLQMLLALCHSHMMCPITFLWLPLLLLAAAKQLNQVHPFHLTATPAACMYVTGSSKLNHIPSRAAVAVPVYLSYPKPLIRNPLTL